MGPDVSPLLIPDATAKQKPLTIAHPVDRIAIQDSFAHLAIAEMLCNRMKPDVRAEREVAGQDAVAHHANETWWNCCHLLVLRATKATSVSRADSRCEQPRL